LLKTKKKANTLCKEWMKRMLLQRSFAKRSWRANGKLLLYFSKWCANYRVQLVEKSIFHILFKSK
jgi:hypothetical protein